MDVSKNSGTPKSSILNNVNRVFPYKPSILGYHYFWKHPYASYIIMQITKGPLGMFLPGKSTDAEGPPRKSGDRKTPKNASGFTINNWGLFLLGRWNNRLYGFFLFLFFLNVECPPKVDVLEKVTPFAR